MLETLHQLQRDGIITTSLLFDAEAVVTYLSQTAVYNAHVTAKSTALDTFAETVNLGQWPMFCHAMDSIVTAPEIFELALGLLPLASTYFGEPALLYSMNAFWTQPALNQPEYQDTHSWHRDGDDRKQLVAFFMLTDVLEISDGVHQYQRGTHVLGDDQLGRHPNAPPAEAVQTIFDVAGAVFLEDTRGLHQAHRPLAAPRGLAWARFGVSDPPESYHWDKLSPVPRAALGARYPKDPDVQRAIHLVVT